METRNSLQSPIQQFATKTIIVAAVVVASIWITGEIVIGQVEDAIDRRIAAVTKVGGREFWRRLETALEKAADPKNDLSPEKKQKLISEIRILSDRWQPFFAAAFGAPDSSSTQASALEQK